MQLDLDFIRRQFPAFEVPSLDGQSFFENAGGSYTCHTCKIACFGFTASVKCNPTPLMRPPVWVVRRWMKPVVRLAAMLGVETDELSFGPSTTQNTYVLSQAVAQWLEPGQSIVVTNQDHEANSGPWRRLAERGITVKEWRITPETGLLDPQDLTGALE